MTTWRISDGTTYHLGGEVEGSSLFARELRESLAVTQEISIAYPGPSIDFDRANPSHVDAVIRHVLATPPHRGVLRVVEAPKVAPLPKPPPSPPDVIH